MDLFIMAWKNIFRNRRRSILNITALSLGTVFIIFGLGWVGGYHKYIYGAVKDFDTGDIQILNAGYMKEKRRIPADINLDNYEELRRELLNDNRIEAVTGRIIFPLEISKGSLSVPLLGRAISPAEEAKITTLSDYIEEGSYLGDKSGVLIGSSRAKKLDLKVGDPVTIKILDKYSKPDIEILRVTGIFSFGYPAMDDNIIYMDLKTAERLLKMNNEVTKIVIKLKSHYSPEKIVGGFMRKQLADRNLNAYSWRRFAEETVSAVEADTGSFYVILVVIYVLVIIGILNSMSMSIQERYREIGTLRAIGMKQKEIKQLFIYEGICIALISSLISVIISLPVAGLLQFKGIDISSAMPEELPVPFGKRFYSAFTIFHFLTGMCIAALSALVGSFIPAHRASKINIVDVMRGN